MISLTGTWNYIKDEESKLSINYIKKKVVRNDFSGEIIIPSNWNLREFENYSGTLWYIRKIKIPKNKSWKRLFFEGVDYFTDVWFNWNYLGSHEGYFQEFGFMLDEVILNDEENIIVIKVTSPIEEPGTIWPDRKKLIKGIFNHHDCRPGGWNTKYGQDRNTGGIWNNVKIIFEKDVVIENVKISSEIKNDLAKLKIIIDYKSRLTLQTEILTKFVFKYGNGKSKTVKFRTTYKPNCGQVIKVVKLENPELWFPWEIGKPALTKIKISSLIFNDKNIQFGIREVKLSNSQEFFINGKRLFLRGTNIIPEQFLSNLTSRKIKKLVTALKKANINIVRIHAHVNRSELLEALDKAGILVWQDFALQWTYDESENFKENAIKQIKDMIKQFYNHSSIVFWCCHNEPGEQIESLDSYLYKAVKEEDQTRIVRRASNYEEHPYDGWYWGTAEHFAATPMGPLVTEFGAQAIPEINSLKKILSEEDILNLNWDAWEYHNFQYEQTFNVARVSIGKSIKAFIEESQSYQATLLKTAIDFYRKKKWNGITGIFQFMFVDGWESISWSVIDYFGKKKIGYYALQKCFSPLYISIDLKKKYYQSGSKLFMELWIINDLHKVFREVELVIYINDIKLTSIKKINIEEDSVIHFPHNKFNIKLPNVTENAELKVMLLDLKKNLIVENKEQIRIFDKRIKWIQNENIN